MLAQDILNEALELIKTRKAMDFASPRLCCHCKQVKKPEEYFKSKSRFDGYSLWCKDCLQQNVAKWKEKHPDETRAMWNRDKRRRRAAMLTSTPYLLPEAWYKLKQEFNGCCAYCGNPSELYQDHVTSIQNNVPSPIVPACESCNSSKSNRDVQAWYVEQSFYDEGRAQHIAQL